MHSAASDVTTQTTQPHQQHWWIKQHFSSFPPIIMLHILLTVTLLLDNVNNCRLEIDKRRLNISIVLSH